MERTRATWWVLLGALPLACAGAEFENNSFTGGVQSASATATASGSSATAGTGDEGSGTDAENDGGTGDASQGSSEEAGSGDTQSSAEEAEGEGPEGGSEDGGCVPGEEICDGLDNDCDTEIDEDDPLLGAECQTGMPGGCAAGTNECQDGALVCAAISTGSDEICNGADDDCDGTADQGNPGGGGACNTGLPGVCGAGTNACQGGAIVCNQNLQPANETCDGEDDDCDGVTDEGNPGGGGACNTGQQGVCAAGTLMCQNSSLVCAQNVGAGAEQCGDGLDNDCDGSTDENCGCSHDECVTGAALVNGCSSCVSAICAIDAFCCNNSWDNLCVGAVDDECGEVCQGSCSHTPCATGVALVQGCDPGGCVTEICAVDPFCCNNSWDAACVGEVSSVCNLNC